MKSLKKKVVQITITENCNLNCVYCYEVNRDKRVMQLDLAKSIIYDSLNNIIDVDIIEFDFHGGEIALAFDVIKDICEWTWSQNWSKDYIFHATTNGTLIHGEIQNWFEYNSNKISLGLSLDGGRFVHNINRSNSYDNIDFEFFKKAWSCQSVKMTISPQTLPFVSDSVIHITDKGFRLSANLAYGQDWSNLTDLKLYYYELYKLAAYYLEHPLNEVCNLLAMGLSSLGQQLINRETIHHRKWCGTGEDMVCYSIDGNKYPCQLFNPSSNNYQDRQIIDNIDFNNIEVDQKCASCLILPFCPSCYGYHYTKFGNIKKQPDELCDFRKIEAFASSYLLGKMLLEPQKYNYTNKLSDLQIASNIVACITIQTALKEFIKSKINIVTLKK